MSGAGRAGWIPLLAAALASGAGAQTPPSQPPSFPSEVAIVRIDVVVTDRHDAPVAGLGRDDFAVEEDGQPQPIVSFEAFREPGAVSVSKQEGEPHAAARVFALVVDDVGMDVWQAAATRRALAQLFASGVRTGDRVLLATTSGSAWWTARVPEGREDLVAIAKRLRGRTAASAGAYVTDLESYQFERGPGARTVVQRVVARWIRERRCFALDPGCAGRATAALQEHDAERRDLVKASFATLRRAIRALEWEHGRKTLIFFSKGFPDSSIGLRAVLTASRETQTTVYFVDARGLVVTTSQLQASASGLPPPGELARLDLESGPLLTAGTTALARESGGFSVRNTNDLAAGVERIAAEAGTYYLLGIQPLPGKKPGRLRKLKVKVTRPGLTVRARRGYAVKAAGGDRASERKADGKLPPAVEALLDSVQPADDIPLRTRVYVFEPRPKGAARVVVVAELDAAGLRAEGAGPERKARLELSVAATERDTGRTHYLDTRVEVRPHEKDGTTWRSVAKELDLPAGVAQVRVVLRDSLTGARSAATERIEVRPAKALHLSTPIVTNRMVEGAPALTARRSFGGGGRLYCQFEVFGAATDPKTREPRVASSLEVRGDDGETVLEGPSTPIEVDREGRLVRRIGFDLDGFAPGSYTLLLKVRDEVAGATIEDTEPFTLTP